MKKALEYEDKDDGAFWMRLGCEIRTLLTLCPGCDRTAGWMQI